MAAIPLASRTKEKLSYGEGLIVNIPVPEAEVVQVVQGSAERRDQGNQGIQQGPICWRRNRRRFLQCVSRRDQKGKVFYKVRMHAIDPRNFKDSGDVGTLVVRYVIPATGREKHGPAYRRTL